MSIKLKLISGFGVVLLLLLIVTGVFEHALSNCITEYSSLYSGEVAIDNDATEVRTNMLQCRRNEKDFLQRKNLKYIDKFKTNLNLLEEHTTNVIALATEQNLSLIIQLCNEVLKNSKGYGDALESVVHSFQTKGLDHKSGLQGAFREAAHELSTEVAKRDIDAVFIAFLQLRRYEKDFALSHDKKHLDKWDKAISTYISALDNSTCCENSVKSQKEGLAKYLEARKTYLYAINNNTSNTDDLYQIIRGKDAAGKMYTSITNSYVSGAMSALLTIRKNEKDYLLRNDKKYATAVINGIDKLKKLFIESTIKPDQKEIVYNLSDKYLNSFKLLVAEDNKIDEHLALLTEEAHNIEFLVEKVHTEISPLISKGQTDTNDQAMYLAEVAIILALAAIVIGVIIAILIMRSIITPVMKVVDFAGALQQGNLEVSLKEGKDELGRMGKALNNLSYQMNERAEIATVIAGGDLRVEVTIASEKDRLGQSLQQMVTNLNELLSEVIVATTQVSTAASQISSASEALSQGSTESASSLEEITASMTEMGSQTDANASNAKEANQLAGVAESAASTGQERMNQMTASMDQISNNALETQKVIKTIDDIAFQTNLLALNAAVEAARAGVHGKGFAVVAEEVRNLAARSAKAAAETEELIDNSNRQIQEGVEISTQTAESLTKITDNVSKTRQLVGEIDFSSNEQAIGISQISAGLLQVDSVTQQNTASAEETASAAEELATQATMLQNLVSRFKLKTVYEAATPMVHTNISNDHLTSDTIMNTSHQILLDNEESTII